MHFSKYFYATGLVFIFLLFFSCKKAETEPAPHENTLSAKVNGAMFSPVSIQVLYGGSSIAGTKQVNIYAKASNGQQIILVMLEYNGFLKTFTQDPTNQSHTIGGFNVGGGLIYTSYAISGEIRLLSIDKNKYADVDVVNGTFQMETDASNGKFVITEGTFSVAVEK